MGKDKTTTVEPVRQRWLNMEGACRHTQASAETLRRAVHSGELPASRVSSGKRAPLVFDVADLDAYIESNRVGGAA